MEPTSNIEIIENVLVQAVICRRPDGTEYVALHPVEIDYDQKSYSYGHIKMDLIEIKNG